MKYDNFRRFLTDLPTLFNPKTSDFGDHFGPPTYPKIGGHLWTFPNAISTNVYSIKVRPQCFCFWHQKNTVKVHIEGVPKKSS